MQTGESQFIGSLDSIPVEDFFRVLERECRMLERRVCNKRKPLNEEAASVLTFRRFLNAVMLDVQLSHSALPADHIAVYRKCIARLVKAQKLPAGAREEFDKTFSGNRK